MRRASLFGQTIGDYALQTPLGQGNMAQVYRGLARDGTAVAVKVMRTELLHETELILRFRREFESVRGVHHDNVVRTFDHGTTDTGLPYLVLEFLDGCTLEEVTVEGAHSAEQAAHWMRQVARGLAACHARGVVHRDLKPDNLMVLPGDHVKVFDFGLSASSSSAALRLTANDLRIGTPVYMAPEYLETGNVDQRADLYALGVILFELLAGEPPFKGSPYQVMHDKTTQLSRRLSSVRTDVPVALDDLVSRLLDPDPNRRPPSARAVEQALS